MVFLSEDVFKEAGVTFRSLERQQNLHLPNGSRLRGVKIMDGLYIARDKHFYIHGSNDVGRLVSDTHVAKMCSFNGLVTSIKRLAEARARTMRRTPSDTVL